MDISIILMIAHAISALVMLILCLFQYKWKKYGKILKGIEREKYLKRHEELGQNSLFFLSIVILLAIIGNLISGLNSGFSIFKSITPRSPHGIFGFIGAALFYYLWKLGITIQKQKNAKEKWSKNKIKHGRAADIIIIIGCIHAFLGFLQLLKII
ncbi:MAG TPA: hypothetical protein QF644_05175 [Candidatus Poseidoniaceae archaeon]|nr:hypothetical protein [Candidatus Poseidoniaceae archaeon]